MIKSPAFRCAAAALLLIISAACGHAEVVDLESFSIDIADGWTYERDGEMTAFISPTGDARLVVVYTDSSGMTAEEIAGALSKRSGGTLPTPSGEGMVFSFVLNGEETTAYCRVDGDICKMVTVSDPTRSHGDAITAMVGSITDR